jgi:hypothetical protein
MPNHVENDLVIRGDPETLKAFMDFARGPAGNGTQDAKVELLSAHKFLPMPKELADTVSGHFGSVGYDAWYGNAERVFAFPWVKNEGVTSREQLTEFLRGKDAQYEAMANRYKDNLEKFGHPTWYEWACANWGTKWDVYDVELTGDCSESGSLNYSFQTAWSPPIPVIQAMSKRFPSLRFALDYFEGGAGFMGSCVYENDQEVEAGSAPYHGNRGG